jgi:thiol:disulfide interchange protein DsbD
MIERLLLIAALLFAGAPQAGAQIDPDDLLPVEQAFALTSELVDGGDAIRLEWDIADGYYMYRHAFGFEAVADGLALGEAVLPDGTPYSDEFFGDVEIYRGGVRATLPIEALPPTGPLTLRVKSQGCADLGVCYPPQRTEITLARPATPADAAPRGGADDLLDRLDGFGGATELTGRSDPLPPEQAFRFETIALGPDALLARFTMPPGYYLYRDTIEFESGRADVRVGDAALPAAEPVEDEYFGETFAYFGEVEIPLPLAREAGAALELPLTVRFQGCQVDGICYPPMQRALTVTVPATTDAPGTAPASPEPASPEPAAAEPAPAPVVESEQNRLARLIEEQPLPLTLALFVLLGIGLAFTPCVFPMVPILSGIIAGEGEDITRGQAFALSLAYVLAMALTYTAVGVIAALAGYNLQAVFQNPWVLSTFAAVFVLLSLAMFGFYNLQLPAAWQARLTEVSNRQSGGSLAGAGIMGFLSALIVGPCVTAPLIGILIFISQTGDAVLGGSVLFALSIGMGVPLLAVGVGLGHWLPRAGGWMESVKAVFGVGLLALAIWMLERILPGGVTMLLWGALAVASGVYLGALTRLEPSAGGWRKLWQALGVILLVFGIMQFVGSAAGGNDWLRPLKPFAGGPGGAGASAPAVQFVEVDNLDQLRRALAGSEGPMMLDFYADWCVTCKEMERKTFSDPAVAGVMNRFGLLKIDMTDFNDEHQAVLNEFGLIGPPAYLFFDGERELQRFRLFGFVAPQPFIAHLEQVERAAG